jgi:hypothetical protein
MRYIAGYVVSHLGSKHSDTRMAYNMQASSDPLTQSRQQAGPSWGAVAFLFVIVLFGVGLIGHIPKWPIYFTILVWWVFVVYTTIHNE